MAIVLYSGPLSLFSRKVEIALREKDLAFERVMVPFTQAAGYQPDERVRSTAEAGLIGVTKNLVSQMIPQNIVQAMADGKPLSVITFSIFFGVVVTLLGSRAKPVTDFFGAAFEVLMKMVHAIMWLAPVGVFSLLAWTVARIGLSVFTGSISQYMIAVLVGLAVHGLILLPVVLSLIGPLNYLPELHGDKEEDKQIRVRSSTRLVVVPESIRDLEQAAGKPSSSKSNQDLEQAPGKPSSSKSRGMVDVPLEN